MGLLDSVLGGLLGSNPNASPLQSILGSLIAGQGQAYGGQQSPVGGGLPGLIQAFNRAGMGNVVSSWVGQGPNQQVSPNQLQQVFGQDQINQWSQQTGMPQQNILSELSNLLPHAVDRVTPNGQVPSSPFDAPGLELPQR
jgi:uncharacterized protein YidB (DUF937 family)